MTYPRYPKYKNSGVRWLNEVPEHWDILPLHAVASHNDDLLPESTPADEEIAYLDIGNADASLGIINPTAMRIADAPTRARRLVRQNDVLAATVVSNVETFRRSLTLLTSPAPNLVVSTGFVVLRANKRILPEYLKHLLYADFTAHRAIAHAVGVSLRSYSPSELMRFAVPLPPLAEQGAILRFLHRETSALDSLRAAQIQLIQLLHEKRQTLISRAVSTGLRAGETLKSSGHQWLGEIPTRWPLASLARISSRIVVGIAEAATHAYAEYGTPILRSTNIRAGEIVGDILYVDPAFASSRDGKRINAGDLVTVRTGNAGVTAVVPPELDGCQCFTMLITSLEPGFLPEFYCYYINSLPSQTYFRLEGWGTAQVNISVPILKALPVPVLATDEQLAIVEYLDREVEKLEELVEEAERAICLLQERRTALISAAVTGRIDIRSLVDAEAA